MSNKQFSILIAATVGVAILNFVGMVTEINSFFLGDFQGYHKKKGNINLSLYLAFVYDTWKCHLFIAIFLYFLVSHTNRKNNCKEENLVFHDSAGNIRIINIVTNVAIATKQNIFAQKIRKFSKVSKFIYLLALIFKGFIDFFSSSIHGKTKRKYVKGLGCESVKRRNYSRKEKSTE